MAERLSFKTDETPYNSVLAAEHLGRYAIALAFCKGKSVLDIACGEGYGSAILADGGASSVLGIDCSVEAIASAKSIFSRPDVSFVIADAMDVTTWNPDNKKFDVIVCYETIEHVSSPEALLEIFRQVLAPQGTILISCPNDQIDIDHGASNPFHMRPYTFEEYQKLTTNILGEADQWLLGTPLTGMSILDAQSDFLCSDNQSIHQMNRFISITDTLFLPAQTGHNVSPRNSSFYLGIWNGQAKTQLICAPMSRSAYLDPWYSMLSAIKERDDANENIAKLESLVQTSEQSVETIQRTSSLEISTANEKINELEKLVQISEQNVETIRRSSSSEISAANEKISKLENLVQLSEQRAETIRRTSSFEINAAKEKISKLEKLVQLSDQRAETISRTSSFEINTANEKINKLEKFVHLYKQRTETIRRISSFESERLKERSSTLREIVGASQHKEAELLKEYNSIMEFELNNYKFLINNYSTSRAHRLAALYTREATGSNAITKTFQFSKAALFSAWRAIVRRFNR
ncbi:methyltransferase domain-containing protein [Ochrobactrum sp. GRS2]|nr:methyltransferase domain-containing protein [Ochrobactrum sp. GRS2]